LGETGLPRDTDPRKSFPVGKEIEVILLDIDAAARRIRLSVKGVDDAREAAEVRDYSQRAETSQPQSFGSLADKLRGALKTSE
jgi:ribosomal protein S1